MYDPNFFLSQMMKQVSLKKNGACFLSTRYWYGCGGDEEVNYG